MAVTTSYSWSSVVGPFAVNSLFTAGSQFLPAVASLSNGGYFGAWTEPDVPAGSTEGVLGQVISATGTLSGGNIVLNSTTALNQRDSSVAQLTGGNVVVTFTDNSSGTEHIRARLFTAAGTALGADFLADVGSGNGRESDVAALSNGNFVMTQTRDFGGGDNDIQMHILNSSGVDVAGLVGVDGDSSLNTSFSSVAGLTGGNIVVAFEQSPAAGGSTSTWFRLFTNAGVALGAKMNIDSIGTINSDIHVAALQDGGFVVAYTDNGWAISSTEITARVFNANGSIRSSFILANTTTTGIQDKPTLTVLSNGYFLVGWTDEPSGALSYQAFDPAGNFIGSEFQSVFAVVEGEVAALKNGYVGNVRESTVTDGSGDSIRSSINKLVRTSTGDAAANTITGDNLEDVINSAGGDDMLTGAGGNDTINGGAGIDTAVYSGNASNYTITRSGLNTTVVDNRAGSPDGTDTLTSIEHLQFADGIVLNGLNHAYRFFDGHSNDHFYTASQSEALGIINDTHSTYTFEGNKWDVPSPVAGTTTPTYRFYNFKNGEHFLTTSTFERDQINAAFANGTGDYRAEGVGGIGFDTYASLVPSDPDIFATERFYNTILGAHHFSASPAETAFILSGGAGPGWKDEGQGLIVHTVV